MLFSVETVTEYYWDQMVGEWLLLPVEGKHVTEHASKNARTLENTSHTRFDDTARIEIEELAKVVNGHDQYELPNSDNSRESFHGTTDGDKDLSSVIYQMSDKAAKYLNCRRIGPGKVQDFFKDRITEAGNVLKLKDVLVMG